MKQLKKLQTLISGLTLSVAIIASSATAVLATPAPDHQASRPAVTGPQAKPPVEPGTVDAKQTEKLGNTKELKLNKDGQAQTNGLSTLAVPNVGFQSPLNYCYNNLVYTPITNTTGATKYLRVMLWNQGMYRDVYTSVAANSTAYPAFYGVQGGYSAYLYVWDGSDYSYDEYTNGTNTCSVSVTRTYNTGGWVRLSIQNTGTAYASQVSSELAPYPASGTYTGTHYDYPVAGGAAIDRWFSVGTSPYGITSYTSGSTNSPYFFTGDH